LQDLGVVGKTTDLTRLSTSHQQKVDFKFDEAIVRRGCRSALGVRSTDLIHKLLGAFRPVTLHAIQIAT
jgi:hypothetical protein